MINRSLIQLLYILIHLWILTYRLTSNYKMTTARSWALNFNTSMRIKELKAWENYYPFQYHDGAIKSRLYLR